MNKFYLTIICIIISSSAFAGKPECTCWYWGYSAKIAGHTKETAQKTKFYKICSKEIVQEGNVGSTTEYWQGWQDAEVKKPKECPYNK